MRGEWGGALQPHPVQVRISYTLTGVQCQTGFKLRDQSLTPLDVQDCANDVGEWVTEHFRTIFSTEDRFLGVDVVDMVTGEGGAMSFNNITGTIQWSAISVLPTYVQVPVSLKGELRRRYGQGRFLCPVRFESFVDGNVLAPAGVAALQGVLDSFASRYLSASPTNTYRAINAHGQIAPKEATPTTPARPSVPPTFYDVTTLRLNNVMSFVRSRKMGVGS